MRDFSLTILKIADPKKQMVVELIGDSHLLIRNMQDPDLNPPAKHKYVPIPQISPIHLQDELKTDENLHKLAYSYYRAGGDNKVWAEMGGRIKKIASRIDEDGSGEEIIEDLYTVQSRDIDLTQAILDAFRGKTDPLTRYFEKLDKDDDQKLMIDNPGGEDTVYYVPKLAPSLKVADKKDLNVEIDYEKNKNGLYEINIELFDKEIELRFIHVLKLLKANNFIASVSRKKVDSESRLVIQTPRQNYGELIRTLRMIKKQRYPKLKIYRVK